MNREFVSSLLRHAMLASALVLATLPAWARRVRLATSAGEIVLELDAEKAPKTVPATIESKLTSPLGPLWYLGTAYRVPRAVTPNGLRSAVPSARSIPSASPDLPLPGSVGPPLSLQRWSALNSNLMHLEGGRLCTASLVAALGLLLSGCDTATFTSDFATEAPAGSEITGLQANVLGLEFRKADGATTSLEFSAGEVVDLLDLRDGDPLRLFTDEELPVGQYVGVRLLFDEDQDDSVVQTTDREFPLLLAEGAFATVDFSVEEEERSREALTLMLDLRQSLAFDESDDDYTLTPKLRAVRTEDAARIEGAVTAPCPAGTSLSTGGAVYLFSGTDAQVDDLDGIGAEPVATTRVVASEVGDFRYAFRFLPAGEYTLAVTCRGDEDLLGVDDELGFRNVRNAAVDDGEVLQRNLN